MRRIVQVASLLPSIVNHCHIDILLRINDPLAELVAHGYANYLVRVLCHSPIVELLTHFYLECFVISDFNRLNKPCAPCGDELNLNVKCLNGLNNRLHHVHLKQVKEEDGNDAFRGSCNVRSKNKLDPIKHDLLVKPHLLVHLVDQSHGESWDLPPGNCPFWWSLEDNQRRELMLMPWRCDRDDNGDALAIARGCTDVDRTGSTRFNGDLWALCIPHWCLVHVEGTHRRAIAIVSNGDHHLKVLLANIVDHLLLDFGKKCRWSFVQLKSIWIDLLLKRGAVCPPHWNLGGTHLQECSGLILVEVYLGHHLVNHYHNLDLVCCGISTWRWTP